MQVQGLGLSLDLLKNVYIVQMLKGSLILTV